MIEELRSIVREKTAILLPEDKCQKLLNKLRNRSASSSIEELLEKIKSYSALPSWILEEVTINETFFFRHPEQFEILDKYVRENFGSDKIRVLCGGVSTGEEAYSVAMSLVEHNCEVSGMDVDVNCIETARKGVYGAHTIMRCANQYKQKLEQYTTEVRAPGKKLYAMTDELKSRVRFSVANMFSAPLGTYEVVFIRNILIYFNPQKREELVARLLGCLTPGGILFVGAGEIVPSRFQGLSLNNSKSIIQKG